MSTIRFAPVNPFDEMGKLVTREYRVVAVGENGVESVASDIVTLATELDTIPPPKPSAPIVEALYGTFTIRWNFLGHLNETMPHDFNYVAVEMAEAPGGPWVSYGNIDTPGGSVVISGFSDAISTRWFRLVGYDKMLNESVPSDSTQTTVIPMVEIPSMVDTLTDIDARFDGVITDAGNLQGVLNQAKLDITTNLGSINTLKNTTIPALDGRITTAQNWINVTGADLSSKLTKAQSDLTAHNTRINTAQSTADTLKNTTLPALTTRVGTAETDLTNAFGQLNTVDSRVETAKQAALTAAAQTAQAKADAAQAAAESAAALVAQSKVDTAKAATLSAAATTAQQKADQAKADAVAAAKTATDLAASGAKQEAIDAAALVAQQKADAAKNAAITAAATAADSKVATAKAATLTEAANTAQTKANEAKNAAIAASALELRNSLNLIQNTAKDGLADRWAPTGSVQEDTVEEVDFNGAPVKAHRMVSIANNIQLSDYFKVDSTKAYEIRMWYKDPGQAAGTTSTQFYVGLYARDHTGAMAQVNQVSKTTGVVTPSSNVYWFYASGPTAGWREVVGYIFPYGTDPKLTQTVGNGINNVILTPQAREVAIRWLSYYNNSTTPRTTWVTHQTVTETTVDAIANAASAHAAAAQALVDAKADATAKANAAKTAAIDAAALVAQAKADTAKSEALTAAAQTAQTKADQAKTDAIAAAKTATDLAASGAQQAAIDAAAITAQNKADAAKTAAIDAAAIVAQAKADTAKSEALIEAANAATTKANAAQAEAVRLAGLDATNKAGQALTDAKADATLKANGIGKNLSSTAAPLTSNLAPQGSVWRRTGANNTIIGVWEQTAAGVAGTWSPRLITSAAVDNLDIGKLSTSSAVMNQAVIDKLAVNVATVIKLNASAINAGIIDTDLLNALEIAAETAAFQKVDIKNLFSTNATMDEAVITKLFTDVVRAKMVTSTAFIGENAILSEGIEAKHIKASQSMSAKVAEFLTLGVDKLTVTGSATMPAAVITKLWTEVVQSQKITSQMMAIGSFDNFIVDPDFKDADLTAFRILSSPGVPGPVKLSASDQRNYIEIPVNAAQIAFRLSASKGRHWTPVEPGAIYRIRYQANTGTAVTAGTRPAIRRYDANGVESYVAADKGHYEPLTAAWKWIEYTYTVPANIVGIQIDIQREAGKTGVVNFKTPAVTRMNNGELTVDGSVTATHIKGKTITVDELAVNAVEASIIKGGALDFKIITGATFQTTLTANRGVKFDSTGLRAWDTSGKQTMGLDAATGNLTFTGEFQSGLADSLRVVIRPVWVQGTSPQTVGLLFQSKGDDPTGKHAGIYMRTQYYGGSSDHNPFISAPGAMVIHSSKHDGISDNSEEWDSTILEIAPLGFDLTAHGSDPWINDTNDWETHVEGREGWFQASIYPTYNSGVGSASLNMTSRTSLSYTEPNVELVVTHPRPMYPAAILDLSKARIDLDLQSATNSYRTLAGITILPHEVSLSTYITDTYTRNAYVDVGGYTPDVVAWGTNIDLIATSGIDLTADARIYLDAGSRLDLMAVDEAKIGSAYRVYLASNTIVVPSTYAMTADNHVMTQGTFKSMMTPTRLTTEYLDNVTETGPYYQALNADALVSRGYPYALAGLLEVFNPPGNMTFQRYTTYESSQRMYTRARYNTTWYAWVAH